MGQRAQGDGRRCPPRPGGESGCSSPAAPARWGEETLQTGPEEKLGFM